MESELNLSAIYPCEPDLPVNSTLKQLLVVCRHGQRTPMIERFSELVPNLWPFCSSKHIIKKDNQLMPGICYYGQLTDLGKIQMETLGRYIKQYPLGFKNTFVRSTNIPRALETAQHVMNGIGLQAKINVEYTGVEDSMYPPNNCAKFSRLLSQFTTTFLKENEKSLQDLSVKFGYEGLSTHPLFDTLASWYAHQLPSVIKREDLQKFTRFAAIEHWGPYTTEIGYRLGIGRLLKDISSYLASSRDFVLLSGHDSTLAPLLGALDVMTLKNIFWPSFGSALFLETIEWDKKEYIRAKFNNQVLHLPKCQSTEKDGWCPLEDFKKILKEKIPTDFDKECQV